MAKILISPLILLLILTLHSTMLTSHCYPYYNSVHDVLRGYGLPGGIFPKNLKSYTFNNLNGMLEVYFDEPCQVKYETLVRFDKIVTANLTFGELVGVQGLTFDELFLWLPVEDILVKDPSKGLIVFNIGYALRQLSLSLFDIPPICNPIGDEGDEGSYIKMMGKKDKMHGYIS